MGFEVKFTGFKKSIIGGLTDNNAILQTDKLEDHIHDVKTILECIKKKSNYKFLNKIKKYNNDKKISLSNIIMSTYLDLGSGQIITQSGGGKRGTSDKKRTYKSIRYLNNDAPVSYSSNSLPDSLTDSDSDGSRIMGTRISAETHPMSYAYSPEMPVQMPSMQMNQMPSMPVQMPSMQMNQMPSMPVQMPSMHSNMQVPVQLQGMMPQQNIMPQHYGLQTGGAEQEKPKGSYIDMGTGQEIFF
jgi:hypothetical protein